MASGATSALTVNTLFGSFKSIDHASDAINLFNFSPMAATQPPHLAFVLNFNVSIFYLSYLICYLINFNRKLFNTTETELNAIAALANIGFSNNPFTGYKTPAAKGMPIML